MKTTATLLLGSWPALVWMSSGATAFVPNDLARQTPSQPSIQTARFLKVSSKDPSKFPRGISLPSEGAVSHPFRANTASSAEAPPPFLMQAFSECDDSNRPPSLNIVLRSLQQLCYAGSDIRGTFVDHARLGSVASVAHEMARHAATGAPPLTPLAAYCLGHGLATLLRQEHPTAAELSIVIGRDPRPHGTRLADALSRGALAADPAMRVYYTGLATTPACAFFSQSQQADAAVMVTASHLPVDRNGFKIFWGDSTSTTQEDLRRVGSYAMECASEWYSQGMLPPSSGSDAVHCTAWVDWMPGYEDRLKAAFGRLIRGREREDGDDDSSLLQGLTLVLNSGNGAGGFFQQVLADLGADVSGSIHTEPDGRFPHGVPNPESNLLDATLQACEQAGADVGIMLDTDSDRCGFVVPATTDGGKSLTYEPLHRNRLIALLGVVFARSDPGCSIVTDSVTSEGLADFLQERGLDHVRYLKGYANVIGMARSLTESGEKQAPLAIETSGHCAMQENGYLDDGTYTAVKIISLLATERARGCSDQALLDLIADLEEMPEIKELRMTAVDNSLDTMRHIFDVLTLQVTAAVEQHEDWEVDTKNLEGLRIRTGNKQFFMLRKSLHDPLISLQIESRSAENARQQVIEPLLEIIQASVPIQEGLDTTVLKDY